MISSGRARCRLATAERHPGSRDRCGADDRRTALQRRPLPPDQKNKKAPVKPEAPAAKQSTGITASRALDHPDPRSVTTPLERRGQKRINDVQRKSLPNNARTKRQHVRIIVQAAMAFSVC